MRVLCDGVVFENNHQRGIQRYFRELLRRITGRAEVDLMLGGPAAAELPEGCRLHSHSAPGGPLSRLLDRALGQRARGRRTALADVCHVFHSTFFTLPPVESIPQVVTVHDMIVERYPDLFASHLVDQAVADKREAIEAARLCIAISASTADDLQRFYPEASGKIRVIHHGVDHLVREHLPALRARPRQAPEGAYVLYVGDRGGYKNFRALLEAAALADWPRDVAVVVAGPPIQEAERLLIRSLGLERRVTPAGRVGDEELTALYVHATALIVPSLWEGFGFPALEAQALGVPVVCSRIRVFNELMADTAAYFDPRLPETIAEAVRQVMGRDVRERIAAEGRANVRRFTWDACANRTLAVYEEAAGAPAGSAGARYMVAEAA